MYSEILCLLPETLCVLSEMDGDVHDTHKKSFNLHNFLDSKVRYLQYIPYSIGLAGLYVISKRLKVASKFFSANQVPEDFVTKRISLRGKVLLVKTDTTLVVDHYPILRHRWLNSKKGALNVKLYGIAESPKSEELVYDYIKSLNAQEVWFKLWEKSSETSSDVDPVLFCTVTQYSWPFNRCINVEVLRNGLAKRTDQPIDEDWTSKLMKKRLDKAERYAYRKRIGLWQRPSYIELIKSDVESKKTVVTNTGMKAVNKCKAFASSIKGFFKK